MTPEEDAKLNFKVGETYLLPVTVYRIEKLGWLSVTTCNNYEYRIAPSEVKTLLQNGIKNTEPAPKYDPCRLLRKGDKVQVKKRDGRCNGKAGEYLREAFCTVAEDETQNELVRVLHNATEYRLDPAYLELVTPVEELEPYYVGKAEINSTYGEYDTWAVFDEHGYIVAQFAEEAYKPGAAKARAEQERDSRNAEHREELK